VLFYMTYNSAMADFAMSREQRGDFTVRKALRIARFYRRGFRLHPKRVEKGYFHRAERRLCKAIVRVEFEAYSVDAAPMRMAA